MFTETSKCPRNRFNCKPLSNIASDDKTTFICCGSSSWNSRSVKSDKFRVCFVSDSTDTCLDHDTLDLCDQISVFSSAIAAAKRLGL